MMFLTSSHAFFERALLPLVVMLFRACLRGRPFFQKRFDLEAPGNFKAVSPAYI